MNPTNIPKPEISLPAILIGPRRRAHLVAELENANISNARGLVASSNWQQIIQEVEQTAMGILSIVVELISLIKGGGL